MDRTVPAGTAIAAAHDKYWVYRPLLDLIGNTNFSLDTGGTHAHLSIK